LRRAPWQVVVFRGIDRCAVAIRETVAAALASGSLTDAMGRAIPLGSASVIVTAPTLDTGAVGDPATASQLLSAVLGSSLVSSLDVMVGGTTSVAAADRASWIRSQLLEPLATRFGQQGYVVTFDDSLIGWIEQQLPTDGTLPASLVDRVLVPPLASGLTGGTRAFTAKVVDGKPVLVPAKRGAEPPK
jgi:hypothetical protein